MIKLFMLIKMLIKKMSPFADDFADDEDDDDKKIRELEKKQIFTSLDETQVKLKNGIIVRKDY